MIRGGTRRGLFVATASSSEPQIPARVTRIKTPSPSGSPGTGTRRLPTSPSAVSSRASIVAPVISLSLSLSDSGFFE